MKSMKYYAQVQKVLDWKLKSSNLESVMSIQVFATIYGAKNIFIIENITEAEKLLSWSQNSAKNDGLENWYRHGVTLATRSMSVAGLKNIAVDDDGNMSGSLCTNPLEIEIYFKTAKKGDRYDN